MSIKRVLVAVDDSPAALRAMRLAVSLARGWEASVLAVSVVQDGELARTVAKAADKAAPHRLDESRAALLRYVAELGEASGVAVGVVQVEGEPFRRILSEARSWKADLIVMGRSDRRGPASPYLGGVTEHVLEFAECPVLVVPQSPPRSIDPT